MKSHHPTLSLTYNKDIKGIPKPEDVAANYTVVDPFTLTSNLINLGIVSMSLDTSDANLRLISTIEQLLNDYLCKHIDTLIQDDLESNAFEEQEFNELGMTPETDNASRLDIDTRQLLGANVATANQKRDKDFRSAIDAAQFQKRSREKDHVMSQQEINDQQMALRSEYSNFKARTKETGSNFSETLKNYVYSSSDYHYAILNEMLYIYSTNHYVEPISKINKNTVWRHFAEEGFCPYGKSESATTPTNLILTLLNFTTALNNSAPDTDNEFMSEVYKRIDAARRNGHSLKGSLY